MKHTLKVTTILLVLFLVAQFIGLGVVYNYIDFEKSTDETVEFEELPFVVRPEVEGTTSTIFVLFAILIGTGLALLLVKFDLHWLWKAWFLLAVVATLTIAFGALIPWLIAFGLALVLGLWKVFKPNFWIHSFTELFIYGGLAAIFVPLFSLGGVSILLVLIAIYDMYAVWKSKHMITLAKSQMKSQIFAGLLVPYKMKGISLRKPKGKKVVKKIQTAILGGGDIGFPLIFAGVVMKELGLWQSLVIPFFALLGLGLLFWKSEKKKFYPAMPFIGAGCFVGLLVVWLIGLI